MLLYFSEELHVTLTSVCQCKGQAGTLVAVLGYSDTF